MGWNGVHITLYCVVLLFEEGRGVWRVLLFCFWFWFWFWFLLSARFMGFIIGLGGSDDEVI